VKIWPDPLQDVNTSATHAKISSMTKTAQSYLWFHIDGGGHDPACRHPCGAGQGMMPNMHIRPLYPDDIPEAAALLRRAAEEFILHESTPADAAVFLTEQGEQGMRRFLASGYVYHVAEVDGVLAGFIAIRERSHVYSLYVDKRFHRRGIARRLWDTAREAALADGDQPGHPGAFTVNASNHALPFYASLGFVPTAPTQVGIVRYNPMRLVLDDAALVDPA
jgi:ribosomal protein S18 acetylase RimI-like enzyme